MNVAVVLAIAVLFVAVCRKPLKRFPQLFYIVAVLLDVLLIFGNLVGLPVVIWRFFASFHARGLLAFSLFVIVMFVGVLENGSKVKTELMSVRSELSILASILVLGHMLHYSIAFFDCSFAASLESLAALMTVAALVLLFVPLAVTSFAFVKRRMRKGLWRRIQQMAYIFWAFVFVHVLLVLGPSALAGAASAGEKVIVYSGIFLLYFVVRMRRFLLDKKAKCRLD